MKRYKMGEKFSDYRCFKLQADIYAAIIRKEMTILEQMLRGNSYSPAGKYPMCITEFPGRSETLERIIEWKFGFFSLNLDQAEENVCCQLE